MSTQSPHHQPDDTTGPPTGRSVEPPEERLRRLIEPAVADLGLDLEGVELAAAGSRRVLRVAVDQDGGVDLDTVAEATRAVSGAVGTSAGDAVLGDRPYTLEVSSPGVSRPLTLPRHWRRNTGRLVQVRRHQGEPVTGRVRSHDEDPAGGVVLEVSGQAVHVPYSDVRRAKVQVEMKRSDREDRG